jgi:hypothetical protein
MIAVIFIPVQILAAEIFRLSIASFAILIASFSESACIVVNTGGGVPSIIMCLPSYRRMCACHSPLSFTNSVMRYSLFSIDLSSYSASALAYEGLTPVPPHLWHLTTLSPFLSVPLPSQFLHGLFFSPTLFRMVSSRFDRSNIRPSVAATKPEANFFPVQP